MHRLLVALLAVVDAVVAAAIGIGAVLAPLTLLWIFTFGGTADWQALWPAAARVWQLGNLVPVEIALGDEFLRDAALPAEAARFVISLAPLAFAAFTLLFAARSGRRAVIAGPWVTGVGAGVAATAVVALTVLLTSGNPVADVAAWPAVLAPALLYAAGALGGAVAQAWDGGDGGVLDRLHDRVDALPPAWREMPALAVRHAWLVVVGLVGAGAVAVLCAVILRGGEIIALFEAAQVDGLGATALTLAHLAYLPTLLVWAIAWLAGPGFALGVGTSVSAGGTQLGVVPGVPLLGLVPEQGAPWLLLAALVPVALGAVAGWAARSRYVEDIAAAAASERGSDDAGFGAAGFDDAGFGAAGERIEPVAPRAVLAVGIAGLAAAATAALAAAASGGIGPGRLAELGPQPGAVALAIGLEVLLGAAIVLLGPRPSHRRDDEFALEREDAATD